MYCFMTKFTRNIYGDESLEYVSYMRLAFRQYVFDKSVSFVCLRAQSTYIKSLLLQIIRVSKLLSEYFKKA